MQSLVNLTDYRSKLDFIAKGTITCLNSQFLDYLGLEMTFSDRLDFSSVTLYNFSHEHDVISKITKFISKEEFIFPDEFLNSKPEASALTINFNFFPLDDTKKRHVFNVIFAIPTPHEGNELKSTILSYEGIVVYDGIEFNVTESVITVNEITEDEEGNRKILHESKETIPVLFKYSKGETK